MGALQALILMIALAAAGCIRFGFEGAPAPDAPSTDTAHDQQMPDAPLPDGLGPPELSPLETTTLDTTTLDTTTPDTTTPDATTTDTTTLDTKQPPDTLVPDTAQDGPPTVSAACASGKVAFQYAANMMVCSTGSKVNQCDAPNACNQAGGWQLCTASQFTSRGGQTIPCPIQHRNAWLASCIRSGGKLSQPTDTICGSCVSQVAPPIGVGCPCSNCVPQTVISSNMSDLGLTPWDTCYSWGTNNPGNNAYWSAATTDSEYNKVVCCE